MMKKKLKFMHLLSHQVKTVKTASFNRLKQKKSGTWLRKWLTHSLTKKANNYSEKADDNRYQLFFYIAAVLFRYKKVFPCILRGDCMIMTKNEINCSIIIPACESAF